MATNDDSFDEDEEEKSELSEISDTDTELISIQIEEGKQDKMLESLLQQFSPAEQTELYKHFHSIDLNHDSSLDFREFQKSLKGFGFGIENSLLAHLLFNAFDKDNNRFISRSEWVYAMSVLLKGTSEQKLNFAYRLFDEDRTGELTQEKFQQVIESVYSLLSSQGLAVATDASAFVNYLFSQTGPSKSLNRPEFIALLSRFPMTLSSLGLFPTMIEADKEKEKEREKEREKDRTITPPKTPKGGRTSNTRTEETPQNTPRLNTPGVPDSSSSSTTTTLGEELSSSSESDPFSFSLSPQHSALQLSTSTPVLAIHSSTSPNKPNEPSSTTTSSTSTTTTTTTTTVAQTPRRENRPPPPLLGQLKQIAPSFSKRRVFSPLERGAPERDPQDDILSDVRGRGASLDDNLPQEFYQNHSYNNLVSIHEASLPSATYNGPLPSSASLPNSSYNSTNNSGTNSPAVLPLNRTPGGLLSVGTIGRVSSPQRNSRRASKYQFATLQHSYLRSPSSSSPSPTPSIHNTLPPSADSPGKSRDSIVSLGNWRGSSKKLTGDKKTPSVKRLPALPRALRPGLPISFGHQRFQIALNLMIGIRLSVETAKKSTYNSTRPLEPSEFEAKELIRLPCKSKAIFIDYAPVVFRRIRELSGITESEYSLSLGPEQFLGNLLIGNFTTLTMKPSSGKSGSLFFTSYNQRFMVKTISRSERKTLKKLLLDYTQHIEKQKDTLLSRILGFHKLGKLYVVVLGNVLSHSWEIHEVFDLKGSTLGRTCKDGPEGVQKDLDFNRSLRLPADVRKKFVDQLKEDSKFLEKKFIIDYSLLLGIHYLDGSVTEITVPLSDDKKGEWLKDNRFTRLVTVLQGESDPTGPIQRKEIYLVGIIDILTSFDFKKSAESMLKSLVHNNGEISAIPPREYGDRFRRFLSSIFLKPPKEP